jgi:hypothetical protein
MFRFGESAESGKSNYLNEGGTVCIFALMIAIACGVISEHPLVPTFASANALPFSRVCDLECERA